MKPWIPVALAAVVVFALLLFAVVGPQESQGSALGIVNSVGIASVFLGVLAALVILRRASPPS